MTKETLQRANELNNNINRANNLLRWITKANQITIHLESWDANKTASYETTSYDEFTTDVPDWLAKAIEDAVREHKRMLKQELDAL